MYALAHIMPTSRLLLSNSNALDKLFEYVNRSFWIRLISDKLKNIDAEEESISNIFSSSALFKEISLLVPNGMQLVEMNLIGNKLSLNSKINHPKPIELLNAFLIRLEDSEFINFDEIDLTDIKSIKEDSEDEIYSVNIESKISNNFANINQKYLKELGSLGLSNRINSLNKIFKDNKWPTLFFKEKGLLLLKEQQ